AGNSASSAILAQGVGTAAIVDLLISAAPVVFGESTGPRASTRKPPSSTLSENCLLKKKYPPHHL
ncbi:hypothetical protein ACVGXT_00055, partial [Enterobacter intestinihominis]